MESFEKKMLLELLKTIKECDNRLKTLEEVLYVEDSEVEDIVTPITVELYDAIKEATGSKLIFMAIA
tara:strand:+ start:604 stop:804 length:201 start_codon:yes stop_codon:yes gene_type:complete